MVVDRHAEAFNPGVEQGIDQRPIFAVDVAVHGVADVEAVAAA
ncbi:MAG: hypothetical protein R2873_14110 [Caldilineaceae bacterium]